MIPFTSNHPTEVKSAPIQMIATESDCCATTEEGASICIVPESGKASGCGCSSQLIDSEDEGKRPFPSTIKIPNSPSKIKSGIMFGIACIASPCGAPLIMPFLLILLAGTPIAIWISANMGWVYGGLTLFALISFFLAYRWWPRKQTSENAPQRVANVKTN